MADKLSRVWLGRRAAAALGVSAALVLSGVAGVAPTVAASPVQGWLGDGATWPGRALVLFPPQGATVDASTVHLTEAGARVRGVSVTPISQARPGDFGVMVVLDHNRSMAGSPTSAAMAAVRSLAATRAAGQQLGLITFSSRPQVYTPLTSDSAVLSQNLSQVPPAGRGADVPSAIKLGLTQLADAKLALGAIIVVSDGVGQLTGSSAVTPAAVKAAATAANVPVFTVGLQDQASSSATLSTLASVASGQYVSTSPARLASVFHLIYSTLSRGSVVRWQSIAPPGRSVAVAAAVTGVPGSVQATYQSPGTAAPASTPSPATAAATHPLSAADISLHNQLSQSPSFVTSAPAASAAAPATPGAAGRGSFWNTSRGVIVVAALCGLLFALAVAMAVYQPSRRAVRTRVGSYIPGPVAEEDPEEPAATGPKRLTFLQRFERGTWWPPFVENVEISGSEHSPVALVKRAAAIGLVVGLLATVATGSILIALIPMLLWPFGLRKWIARKALKEREKFRDTLPGYLQDLASAMRVGRSFVGGLTAVVESADEPVRGAFERAITDEALGLPIEQALEIAATRMQAPDLEQVALIAGLNRRSGSNVAEALDRVAEGARDRADLRREVKALTGQARMSSWVLTALPGVLLLGINVVSPLYAKPLLHTTIGIVLLFVAAMMVYGGWKVMKKITDVEP
ncbi:MAG: VWA domain-containing protein [Solirubrobacteraceae bacterium]